MPCLTIYNLIIFMSNHTYYTSIYHHNHQPIATCITHFAYMFCNSYVQLSDKFKTQSL